MPHSRAQPERAVDQGRGQRRGQGKGTEARLKPGQSSVAPPGAGKGEGDKDKQTKKRLGEKRVEDSDLIFQHRHPQPAEDSLEDDRPDRDQTQVAKPAPRLGQPEPEGQDQGREIRPRRQ